MSQWKNRQRLSSSKISEDILHGELIWKEQAWASAFTHLIVCKWDLKTLNIDMEHGPFQVVKLLANLFKSLRTIYNNCLHNKDRIRRKKNENVKKIPQLPQKATV